MRKNKPESEALLIKHPIHRDAEMLELAEEFV